MLTEEEKGINSRFIESYYKLKVAQKVGSKDEFCVSVGLPKGSFSRYETYKRVIPKESISLLAKIHHIPEDWLLLGDASSIETVPKAVVKKEFTGKGVKRIEAQSVPLYDFEASAGLVKLFDSRPNVLDYIQIPNMPKCDGAIHITGDSMYPLLKSGDIVMYKVIPDIRTGIIYGNMYLLSATIGGEVHTMVKYLQKSPEGDEFIRLASQNSHHEPIDIPRDDIKALAFVKASIRINSMS